jgi:hypothetical protein
LIIPLLLLLEFDSDFSMTLFINTIMPVTTRSQSKASKGSFSYIGGSNLSNSLLTNSTVECSHVYATDSSQFILSSTSSLVSNNSSMHHATEYHTSISSSLDFQTSPAYFEISKILPVDSELTCIGDRPDSHNSSSSNILTMEADCEDNGNATLKHSPPLVDIEKLFSAFTQQIASQIVSQTNLLWDKIRDNELLIVQDNEEFKIEMREEINELWRLIQL